MALLLQGSRSADLSVPTIVTAFLRNAMSHASIGIFKQNSRIRGRGVVSPCLGLLAVITGNRGDSPGAVGGRGRAFCETRVRPISLRRLRV